MGSCTILTAEPVLVAGDGSPSDRLARRPALAPPHEAPSHARSVTCHGSSVTCHGSSVTCHTGTADLVAHVARDLCAETSGRTSAGYSISTRKQHLATVEELAAHFGRPVAELGRDELRADVEHLWTQQRSASWLKMKLSAMAFVYRKTLGRPKDVSFIGWPKQRWPLPTVLSADEVQALLRALANRRHRAIGMVLYGAGLRISEALALEVTDIDGARGVLRVRHGKGNRALEAKLSPALYVWLRRYWAAERPPRPYLLASAHSGRLSRCRRHVRPGAGETLADVRRARCATSASDARACSRWISTRRSSALNASPRDPSRSTGR
ncbi:tyrosine-type recombinase/integrase [Sorangium sp. So ce1036]|uniref:tyrosine-type recombinase/integrase n=1 Tax=Sorangium sp. So ce1036 TaxID=3133328 RepID=UPI003F0E6B96